MAKPNDIPVPPPPPPPDTVPGKNLQLVSSYNNACPQVGAVVVISTSHKLPMVVAQNLVSNLASV